MTSKHTPGPWTLEISERSCFHKGNRCSITKWDKDGDEDTNVTIAEVWPANNDIDIADARLIAAAPELLTALEIARECIAYCRRNHPDAQKGEGLPVEFLIDAALAKARQEG